MCYFNWMKIVLDIPFKVTPKKQLLLCSQPSKSIPESVLWIRICPLNQDLPELCWPVSKSKIESLSSWLHGQYGSYLFVYQISRLLFLLLWYCLLLGYFGYTLSSFLLLYFFCISNLKLWTLPSISHPNAIQSQ